MAQDYRNTLADIKKIINKGIKRPIPPEKENIHYGDFAPIINLLKDLAIDSRLFTDELTLEETYSLSSQVLELITSKLLAGRGQKFLLDQAYRYLAEQDKPENSDVIFVFGGKSLSRPQKAAELFIEKYAPIIYCSGSRPIEEVTREHEGRKFKEYIVSNFDIAESAVISDPNENSLSMVENVKGFLNYCDQTNFRLKTVILIIQEHNLRRAWTIFMKYTNGTRLLRYSCGQLEGINKDNWYKTPLGIKLVYEEYEKIRIQQILNSS